VSGRDIIAAARRAGVTILAANARNPLTIRGVLKAAAKLDAAVLFGASQVGVDLLRCDI